MMFSRDELIEITGAVVLKDEVSPESIFAISTDTRTITNNDIYLPLKGVSFDGENFIDKALEAGSIAYFTTKDNIIEHAKLVLKVENTLDAYLKIAQYFRLKNNPITVGITGSSGKTTTKEIVASTLESKYKVFKTPLNHNNEVGLCQTIFEMPDDTEVLVLEMGMRGLGEIELLSKYAEPDITIVSNVGTAHIGRLGRRENIEKAKEPLYSSKESTERAGLGFTIMEVFTDTLEVKSAVNVGTSVYMLKKYYEKAA